ncbi:ORF38 [macacine gammaherpesvirus 12]|uniref:Cytoplasmic envelopment protein 3 n=1 Tax=macacine gammaherpesvirus 12 TaxID=2560571 RepID=A0A0B5D3K5_9GAMA|nr:ORF38 [Macaca nemestrina rhadinovirus 2]AJE29681.1 ORF38 [Macaca nemestrina rhadinovirus 2]
MGFILSVCKRPANTVDVKGEPIDVSKEFDPIIDEENIVLLTADSSTPTVLYKNKPKQPKHKKKNKKPEFV